MRLFVTHMPGFTPDTWPVVSFCHPGPVKSLKERVDASDGSARVLFVGSGSSRNPEERGRLLGLVDVYRQPIVPTQSVISGEHLEEPNSSSYFNKHGSFRWPCGLAIKRAWTFDERPDAHSHIGEQQADGRWLIRIRERSAAYELTDAKQTHAIMKLPKTAVKIVPHKIIKTLRSSTYSGDFHSSKQTTGPAPSSSFDDESKKQKTQPASIAYCYIIRFDDTDCYKVGWTTDMRRRIKEINAHIPTEVIGTRLWSSFKHQEWCGENCEIRAYKMEQMILTFLSAHRTVGERLCCSQQKILVSMKAAYAHIASQ